MTDLTTPAPAATLDAPPRPDVFTIPGTGMEWCQCGQDHELTRAELTAEYADLVGPDGRVPHPTVVLVTQRRWGYEWVCRFFHLRIEDAARAVAGDVLKSYELADAVDITGLFSKAWQGCPEESCQPAQ